MLGDDRDKLKVLDWRNLRADEFQGIPATIQCRILVFEITVSGYTELLLCLLSHKGTYTLSTTIHLYQFIACCMRWILWKTIVRELKNT